MHLEKATRDRACNDLAERRAFLMRQRSAPGSTQGRKALDETCERFNIDARAAGRQDLVIPIGR